MKVRWEIKQPVFLLISSVFLTLSCFSLSSAETNFSPDIPVTLGSTTFDERDVVSYENIKLDGEAIGLPKGVEITAYTPYQGGVIIFAIDVPATLDGVAYNCQDLIMYDGIGFGSLGSVSGVFGAPPGACIDALSADEEYLYFSLDIPASLLVVDDLQPHDVYAAGFLLTNLHKAFDGSDYGISEGADLNGIDVSPGGHMRMSFDVPTEFAGLELTERDICDYDATLSSWSSCFYGAVAGLPQGMNIDAISVSGGCDCEGNFNNDEDVDGTDAFDFKVDFGRSLILNPCETGNPCNGDFTCDGDVDGSDAFIIKEDFGRSSYINPCPVSTRDPWCTYP